MIIGSNFFIDFENILRERRWIANDFVNNINKPRWRNERYLELKTAKRVADFFRNARIAFDHAIDLARLFDNAINRDNLFAVYLRKRGDLARFIKPMNFDARVIKNGDVIPTDIYQAPDIVTENTFGDLYLIERNHFKDALAASAQFAFNKFIAANVIEQALAGEHYTGWFQAAVSFDNDSTTIYNEQEDSLETRVHFVSQNSLRCHDFIKAVFRRSLIQNAPGKTLHSFKGPDYTYQSILASNTANALIDTVNSIINEGVIQGRANLIKFALERKHA